MDRTIYSQIFFMMNLIEEISACEDCNFDINKWGFNAETLLKLTKCVKDAQLKHRELDNLNVEEALIYLEEILALPENFRDIEIGKINKSLSFYFL